MSSQKASIPNDIYIIHPKGGDVVHGILHSIRDQVNAGLQKANVEAHVRFDVQNKFVQVSVHGHLAEEHLTGILDKITNFRGKYELTRLDARETLARQGEEIDPSAYNRALHNAATMERVVDDLTTENADLVRRLAAVQGELNSIREKMPASLNSPDDALAYYLANAQVQVTAALDNSFRESVALISDRGITP